MSNQKGLNGFRPKLITIAVASCFATSTALANPTGHTVVNGTATFKEVGNVLRITNSPNAVINWQSFSIGTNELTRFIQQSQSSTVLNRVTGSAGTIDPSVILGSLKSNGHVYLLNPSGVVFGAGSVVDVGGLVATSLNLSNADFLANNLRFTDGAGAGSVVNQGTITTRSGGEVLLVGSAVTNGGVIASPGGQVILAAGERVELVDPGTPNLRVEVSAQGNKAINLGRIVADSGRVGIYAGLVQQSGTIRANSAAVAEGGRIVLRGTQNVTVDAGSLTQANGGDGGRITIQSGDTTLVAGAVEAKGSSGEGGSVKILGNLVGLTGNASVDASGESGGGRILVGGDFRGENPNVQNAFRTYVGQDVALNADAITEGDGGRIVVWSDDATRFYGNISAHGGAQGGNGGFAEVSSKGWLDYRGLADLSAANGQTGTLLLDPTDVSIVTGDTIVGGTFDSSDPNIFSGNSVGGSSTVGWTTIKNNLATADVMITTSGPASDSLVGGNITVVNNSPDLASSHSLSLFANRDITVNGSITNSGTGDLSLISGWNESTSDAATLCCSGSINIGKNITTGGGITISAANQLTVNGNAQIVAGGDVALRAFDSMNLQAANKVQGENILISSGYGDGTFAFDESKSGGALQLAQADIDKLRLNDPASGFLNIEAGHIDVVSPITFDPTKVQTLALAAFSSDSITQQTNAPLTVKNLVLESNGDISMMANNSVDKLAGSTTGGSLFEFKNSKSLVIGSIGGSEGVTVTGTTSGAKIDISTTSGTLTVDAPVSATAQVFGDALVKLSGKGNVTVNAPIEAVSTSEFFAYGGGVKVVSQTGNLMVNAGGMITAVGAYGGDAGIRLQAGQGVTLKAAISAVGSESEFGVGGNAGIEIAAGGGPVTINAPVTAVAGPGSEGFGAAGITVSSETSNIALNSNVSTTGSGNGFTLVFGNDSVVGAGGILMNAGDAIVAGAGVLSSIRGTSGDFRPTIQLMAVNGIGTPANPVRIQDGSDGTGPHLNLHNSGTTQGDIAVAIMTGNILIDGPTDAMLGTFNANPNGTYYIEAKNGNIVLAAPFKPGIETADPLLSGQSVTLKASGNVQVRHQSEPVGVVIGESFGGIETSGGGKIKLDAGGNIVTDAGTTLSVSGVGSAIDLKAGTTIASSGALTGGPVSAKANGNISIDQSQGIKLGLIDSANGSVTISTGGAITDGNDGLNIGANSVTLNAGGGVGTFANPIETNVANLSGSASGGFNVINSGDLTISGSGVNVSGGDLAIGSSAVLTVAAPVTVSSGNALLQSNNGMIINQQVFASGNLDINSGGGDLGIAGTSVSATNINLAGNNIFIGSTTSDLPTTVVASNLLKATSAGNFFVLGGANDSANAVLQGLDVDLTVGTSAGVLNIDSGTNGASAQIRAGSPDTITITFPNLGEGGYFVNGVENALYDPATNTGFFANGHPAALGAGFVVTYGQPAPVVDDPTLTHQDGQIVANINNQTDPNNTTNMSGGDEKNLADSGGGTTGEPEGQANKKSLPVCK